jgi:hypothetical protein
MLEPDPDFNGGVLTESDDDCQNNIVYYSAANKIWDCPWVVNSKSNWLKTDGFKIVVDTSLATASSILYRVYTFYSLWCACTDSVYQYKTKRDGNFYFQI